MGALATAMEFSPQMAINHGMIENGTYLFFETKEFLPCASDDTF